MEGKEASQGRLLVMTYHFPPDPSVGGLRWAGLSKYLARRGWEVHVLTSAPQKSSATEPGVHVHVRERARTLNDLYNNFAQRVRSGAGTAAVPGPAPAAGASAKNLKPGALARLRKEFAAVLSFPDNARGWILGAAREARQLLDRMSFDAVVSSGPPHSVHVAAVLATFDRPGLLRVDMRDPWADIIGKDWGRTLYGSSLSRFATPHMESIVMRHTSGVIANTSEFADALRVRYPHMPVAFVPNGIDPERLPKAGDAPADVLRICHVGTLYAGRDISPVLEALRIFLERRPEARARLRLELAGAMGGDHAARFQQQVTGSGLSDIVHVHGIIPNQAALELLGRSHLALVLAQNQQMQIPAKIYECVGMKVPTLVITEEGSAASREAQRIGAFARPGNDYEGICGIIDQLWTGQCKSRIAAKATIEYEGLAAEMEAVLNRRSRRR